MSGAPGKPELWILRLLPELRILLAHVLEESIRGNGEPGCEPVVAVDFPGLPKHSWKHPLEAGWYCPPAEGPFTEIRTGPDCHVGELQERMVFGAAVGECREKSLRPERP